MERLVIDTETSGLSPRFNKILTVGMLHIDVEEDFLEILSSKHLFVKHDDYCANSFALRINRINLEEHHKVAEPSVNICKRINSFLVRNKLQKVPVVGHNLRFDQGFLAALSSEGNIPLKFHDEQEDTMVLWKELKMRNVVSWGLRSNLKTLANYFDVDYSRAHGALEDCEITAKVYQKMLGII